MKTISLLITFSLLYTLCDEDGDGAEVNDYLPDSVDILRLLKWRYDDMIAHESLDQWFWLIEPSGFSSPQRG